MGIVKNVGFDKWPKQGQYLGKRARVCFRRDTSREVMGTIIRDDMEEPWLTVLKLDDQRVVLGTECMYSPVDL